MRDQYIPDITERFPEGFDGVDRTDSYFYEPRYSNDPYATLAYLESPDFDDLEDFYEDRNYNRLYSE